MGNIISRKTNLKSSITLILFTRPSFLHLPLNPRKMKIGFFFSSYIFISVNMIMRRQQQSMNNNNNNNKECSGFFICCFCTRVLKFRGSLNASECFGMNAKTLHYAFFFVPFSFLFRYIFFVCSSLFSSPHQRAFDIVYLVLY